MNILLTGGAGYIGSHIAVELINQGHKIIIVDNFSNNDLSVINRLEKITGEYISYYKIDIADSNADNMFEFQKLFSTFKFDVVIHLAGFKAVGESVNNPLKYYYNNINATLNLLNIIKHYNTKLIFSSSATVYGTENKVPYTEDMKRGSCSNPYGWTKSMIEQIIEDTVKADDELSAVILRYFNPIGAHESGLIGDNPKGIPNNLMPYITQTAAGSRECLTIFGNDYPTPDGTCLRDYIHVVDLAKGHIKAMDYVINNKGVSIFNLGTGVPYSVVDIVTTFEKVNDIKLNYTYGSRRPGDLAECYADVTKANKILDWKAEKTLEDMCRDSWNYQLTFEINSTK